MSRASPPKKSLFTPAYLILTLASLITALGYSMIASLISTYAVSAGSGLEAAGMLGGVYSLAALATRPIGGLVADRLNKKRLCLAFTLLISLVMAGYAMAPNLPALFAVRILHGAAFGINSTASVALISECIPVERLGEGLGYYGLGQVVSQVCGPALGVWFRDRWGYRALFLAICALTLAAAAALMGLRDHPGPVPASRRKAGRGGPPRLSHLVAAECLVYSLVGGMFSLGNGIMNAFLLLVGEERNIQGISLFFSVSAAVLFAVRMFAGRAADRASLALITNLSLAATAASMLMVGWARSLPVMLTAAALKALGQGGGQLSLQSACIRKAGAGRVGVATSTFYIGADIGQGFGPILGGSLSARWGYGPMLAAMASVVAISALGFSLYQRRQAKAAGAAAHS